MSSVDRSHPALNNPRLRDGTANPNDPQRFGDEDKYRSFVDNFQGIAFRGRMDFTPIFFHGSVERMTGYTEEEFLAGQPRWDQVIHPDDLSLISETFELARSLPDHAVDREYRIVRRGGQIRWVAEHIQLVFDADDQPSHVQGTILDITERKKAEETAKLLSMITEQVADSILIADPNFRITYVNPAFERLFGYTLEEIKGQTPEFLDAETDAEKTQQELQVTVSSGLTWRGEMMNRKKDGTVFPCELTAFPLVDERGELIAYAESQRDITARRKAEEASREREYILRESQRVAALGSYVLDIAANRWTSSDVLDAVFGIDREYHRDSQGWLEIVHPDHQDEMREYFYNSVLSQHRSFDREYRIIRLNDGQERWVHGLGELEFDADGNPVRMIGTIRDITEQRRAEEALRASEERFRTYVSHAPDAILIADSDGRLVEVNPAAGKLTGYSRSELLDMTVADLAEPELRGAAMGKFAAARSAGSSTTEIRLRKKDGAVIFASLDAVALSNDRLMAFCTDITETKRLRELQSRGQRLETAGQIAGQVAHDFNNLLGPLIAYPEIIREELPDDHPAIPFLVDLEEAAQQIAEINQQLLTLGRRGHYNQDVFDLNDVVKQALRQLGSPPPTLVIEADLDEALLNIKGGRAQILRAVTNLLINSREATQDSGRITVRTENFYKDDTDTGLSRVPRGEYVKLTISDTGCGIPDEIKTRIFDPFFTTKSTDKKRGSGLGISVVDAVVRDHRGYIDMASTPDQGTSFYLYFPTTREEPDSSSQDQVIGGSESVLMVDDDRVQREVCLTLLSGLGYQAEAVEGGEAAIRRLRERRFDLLILDMIMPPGIDGVETLKRALALNPAQKSVILSGFAESERVTAALKLGAGAFVKKPLTRRQLAKAVRSELDRQVQPSPA